MCKNQNLKSEFRDAPRDDFFVDALCVVEMKYFLWFLNYFFDKKFLVFHFFSFRGNNHWFPYCWGGGAGEPDANGSGML